MGLKNLYTVIICLLSLNLFANEAEYIDQFCIAPDKGHLLKIPFHGKTEYSIKNYHGDIVQSGLSATDKTGNMQIDIQLPKGFYYLELTEKGVIYGISALERYRGSRDPFFCIDSAMSWLTTGKNIKYREPLIKQLRDYGVSASRERIWWWDINRSSNKWNFEGGRRNYEELRKLLKKYEISCLDLYHDAPKWTGAGKSRSNKNPYPQNLASVVNAWYKMEKQWGDNWCGWEIWNEPNIGFGNNLPADQYMALVKANAYAAEKSGWKKPLIGGVYSIDYISDFQEQCAENGLLDYINTISYHAYNSAMSMENSIADYRTWLKKYGRSDMPIWLTENGFSFTTGKKGKEYKKELKSSSLNIVIKAVEAKACGIERNFPFVYSAYSEGASSFSMLFKNYSPMPQLATYFNLIQLLNNKDYIGDLICNNTGIKKARIFSDGSDQAIIVIYTSKELNDVAFDFPFRAIDIDGREVDVENGSVNIKSGMVYLLVSSEDIKSRIDTDTKAMELLKASKKSVKQPLSIENDGIVISVKHNSKSLYKHTADGYYVTENQAGSLPVTYNITNLNNQNKDEVFRIDICSPSGKLQETIVEKKITLKAQSRIEQKFNLKFKKVIEEFGALKVKVSVGKVKPAIFTYKLQNAEVAKSHSNIEKLKWHEVSGQTRWLTTGQLWYGVDDLSFNFASSWEPGSLTVHIKVTDNIHHQTFPPEKMWRGDSIQLAVQKLEKNLYPIAKRTTQLCLGVNNGKLVVYADRFLPETTREKVEESIQTSLHNHGAYYIIKIPAKTMGIEKLSAGQILGFTILANDNDGYGRKGALSWGEGIAKYNGNTKTYNKLKLLDESEGDEYEKQK